METILNDSEFRNELARGVKDFCKITLTGLSGRFDLDGCWFCDATIKNSHIKRMKTSKCNFNRVSFVEVKIDEGAFLETTFDGTSFDNCTVDGVTFFNSKTDAYLRNGTIFKHVHFRQTSSVSIRLVNSTFHRSEFNKCGVETLNVDGQSKFTECSIEYSTISYMTSACGDLSGLFMRDTSVIMGRLSSCNMKSLRIRGGTIYNVTADECDFHDFSVTDSKIDASAWLNCDLTGFNCTESTINNCSFENSKLNGFSWNDVATTSVNMSGVIGVMKASDYILAVFDKDPEGRGIIAYKTFNQHFQSPNRWKIEAGQILEETVDYNRTVQCSCGINVAPLSWVLESSPTYKDIWKVLIRWEWLADVVVPINTDGKIRSARVELIERVTRDSD